jgi:hypothetical protein
MKLLTLSRDMAFLGDFKKGDFDYARNDCQGNLWLARHHPGDVPHPSLRVICIS